jgi:phosphoserine/homoserine phosphotransferase
LRLSAIQGVIGSLQPFPAPRALRELRSFAQVIILSILEQFAQPLLCQLEWPTLLCH